MLDRLTRFIRSEGRHPFRWGKHDCATFATRWLRRAAGRSSVPGFPRPSSARAFARLGMTMAQHAEAWAARAGFATDRGSPRFGDVGVIEVDGRQSLAICAGGAWAVRDATGVVLTEADCVLVVRAV